MGPFTLPPKRRFKVAIDGNIWDVEERDAEEAARLVVKGFVWSGDPPGEGDVVTAHVIEVGAAVTARAVESFAFRAEWSLSAVSEDADDEPTAADLRALGVS